MEEILKMDSDFLINLLEDKMWGFIQHVKSTVFNPEFDDINLSYIFKLPRNHAVESAYNVIGIGLYNIGDEFMVEVKYGINLPNDEKLSGREEILFDKASIAIRADDLYSNAIRTYDVMIRDMIEHIMSRI